MAASFRQELVRLGSTEPKDVSGSTQALEGLFGRSINLSYPWLELDSRPTGVSVQAWIEAHPDLPYGYLVYPSSKVSAFLQDLLNEFKARKSKDPLGNIKAARKALRHLRACQTGVPDEQEALPHQPLVAGVTSRAKVATTEAHRGWVVQKELECFTLMSFSILTVSWHAGKTHIPAPAQARSVMKSMLPFWMRP